MEKTAEFLRRLSRFNDEVRQQIRCSAVPSTATRERFAACENAERGLQKASEQRDEAERHLRVAERLVEEARDIWREAVLDERIARADAETQLWIFIAQSEEMPWLRWLWDGLVATKPMGQAPTDHWTQTNKFFSVTRVQDNTYRFFTISHG